jgi:hypothetical protein
MDLVGTAVSVRLVEGHQLSNMMHRWLCNTSHQARVEAHVERHASLGAEAKILDGFLRLLRCNNYSMWHVLRAAYFEAVFQLSLDDGKPA